MKNAHPTNINLQVQCNFHQNFNKFLSLKEQSSTSYESPGGKRKRKGSKETDKTQPKMVTIINIKIKMLEVSPFSISSFTVELY